MPTSTAVRASTQDGAAGTQVAQATNEVGTGAVQTIVPEGNKTTYSETSRTSLSAVDTATDMSTSGFGTSLIDIGNALSLHVRASCSAASKVLTGHLVFYDASSNPISISETITFNSDASDRLAAAGDYICQCTLIDARAARKCKFYVDTLSGGTWAIYVRPV